MEICQQTYVFWLLGDGVFSHQPLVEQILFENMQLVWVFPPFQLEKTTPQKWKMIYQEQWHILNAECMEYLPEFIKILSQMQVHIPNMDNLGTNSVSNLTTVFPAFLLISRRLKTGTITSFPWAPVNHGCHQLPTGFLGAINSSSLQA